MTSVTISNGITSIGRDAFNECRGLTSVAIPESVTSIGGYAFMECRSLTNITIPYGVTSIEERTFFRCHSLTNIVIPESVTSIEMDAFAACKNLESITIPEGVTSIGYEAFGGCQRLESVTIPEGVTSIETVAFSGCSSLTSITIPSSVTSIGYYAFSMCYALESVTILNDNIGIGLEKPGGVFLMCESLNSFRIAVSENISGTPTLGDNCFIGCYTSDFNLTLLTEDGTTELSNTTTPTLAEAVAVYDAADGTINGKWYDWKLPEVPDVTGYPVTITVNLNDNVWSDCKKTFALSPDNGITFITDFTDVSNGIYTIYETTGAADGVGYVNTGVTIEVKDKAAQTEVNYYSVTFYDGDTIFDRRIVLGNVTVKAPSNAPTKDGYIFAGWSASEDGSTEFKFEDPITAETSIYAKWIIPPATKYPVTIIVNINDNIWSDNGKTFALSPDNGITSITDLTDVSNGAYTIYDTTGAADSTGYINTGVTVEVKDSAVEIDLNYYTVTFYDGDTVLSGQIVLRDTRVNTPSDTPKKDGYTFNGWFTSEDGSTGFDFEKLIRAKTDIYAGWTMDENDEELFTITATAGAGGSIFPSGEVKVKSGEDQRFTIMPEEGYRIVSVLVDGNEELNSAQAVDYLRAGITDAENDAKYYDFENVTGDHTLAAYFEAIQTGGSNPEGTGGGDAGEDNGSGGTGGEDAGEDSGSGDTGEDNGSGGTGGGDAGEDSGSGDTGEDSGSGGTGGNSGSGSSGSGGTGGNSGSGSSGSGGTSNDSGSGGSGREYASDDNGTDGSGSSISAVSDTNVSNDANVVSISNTVPASKDNEPKTGYDSHIEVYVTIAMIAGLSYLLLYFADGKNGMTEKEKEEIIASLVKWAKKGKRMRRFLALAIIFLILVYYHSIGKRTAVEWKTVYEK